MLFSESFEQTAFVDHIEDLLHWESKEVIAKAAKVVSEVAKTDLGREKCSNLRLLKLLRNFLKNKEEDIHVITQVCRALGNICYENGLYLFNKYFLYKNNYSHIINNKT